MTDVPDGLEEKLADVLRQLAHAEAIMDRMLARPGCQCPAAATEMCQHPRCPRNDNPGFGGK
jgi:hypothetical protein